MYTYGHEKMTREKFEEVYIAYKRENGYALYDYDIPNDWYYYQRNKSWFASHIDHFLTIPEELRPEWIKKVL